MLLVFGGELLVEVLVLAALDKRIECCLVDGGVHVLDDELLVGVVDVAVVDHVPVERLHVVGVGVHLELHRGNVVALAVRDVLDVLLRLAGVLDDGRDGPRVVAFDVVEGAQVGDLELDERRALLLERLAVRGLAAAGELLAASTLSFYLRRYFSRAFFVFCRFHW